jgi:hypothetical protein
MQQLPIMQHLKREQLKLLTDEETEHSFFMSAVSAHGDCTD